MLTIQTPAARANDPDTSHLAETHINRSGLRGRQQRQAAAAVRCYPGRTSAELAEITGIDRHRLAKRLPECETAGAVRRGDKRQCSVSHLMAIVWYVGEGGL